MCFILFIEDKNSTYSVSDSRNKKKRALQVMLTIILFVERGFAFIQIGYPRIVTTMRALIRELKDGPKLLPFHI